MALMKASQMRALVMVLVAVAVAGLAWYVWSERFYPVTSKKVESDRTAERLSLGVLEPEYHDFSRGTADFSRLKPADYGSK